MVPASLAEDIAVDIEEEDVAKEAEVVEEMDSLDLSDLMTEDDVFSPEANGLDLLGADIYEDDSEGQTVPAVAANAASDFEIDEDGVLVRYNGFDKNVTIPSSVKEIGYGAFYDDTTLESVTIPSSITSIDSYAFSGCTKLKQEDRQGEDQSEVSPKYKTIPTTNGKNATVKIKVKHFSRIHRPRRVVSRWGQCIVQVFPPLFFYAFIVQDILALFLQCRNIFSGSGPNGGAIQIPVLMGKPSPHAFDLFPGYFIMLA